VDGWFVIITIDGPAGAGKSSAARGLAARIHFEYLDTGAMFRAVALALHRLGIDPETTPHLASVLETLRLDQPVDRTLLNGEDVSEAIRTPLISNLASQVAVIACVRDYLARRQREVAAGRNMVCEGRDQGTVVFPDAFLKIFLTADPLERARRRHRELIARGQNIPLEEVFRMQQERDARDMSRQLAPARPAADAVLLDTTHLSLADVLDRLELELHRRRRLVDAE
jgi:cytidylate kinase